MRALLTGCLLLLAVNDSHAQGKRNAAAPARVVVTGKGTLLVQSSTARAVIRPGEDQDKRLKEATKKITATAFRTGGKSGLVVVFPGSKFELIDAVKVVTNLVAVDGVLSSSDDSLLLRLSGTKSAKRVPVLIADKMTLIDAKTQANFPVENHAFVEGIVKKHPAKLGTEAFEWSIQTGAEKLPFVLVKNAKQPKDGGRYRVQGKVRIIQGQWLLVSAEAHPIRK